MSKQDIYIGLMSGTSTDAIDAVALRFSEPEQNRKLDILATLSLDLPDTLRQRIIELNQPSSNELDKVMSLDIELGERFAEAALQLIARAGIAVSDVMAIGSHGQTIRHQVERHPFYTLQIANANVIAQRTGICTVADFRTRDMVAGGQGAPLVPAFHHFLFADPPEDRIIINIGGMANVTFLWGSRDVQGFDTGPGNVLMDAWIHANLGRAYDCNGEWANSGKVNQTLLETLLAEPYFRQQPPKSTGRDLFDLPWLKQILDRQEFSSIRAEDVQATLLMLSCESIGRAIETWGPEHAGIYICGGGSQNQSLIAKLSERLPHSQIANTGLIGLDPLWVEACAFAWLAKQCLEGKAANLPSVTGARDRVILGSIYPAMGQPISTS